MHRYRFRLQLLAYGAITFGWLQAAGGVDFNQIWYQLLTGWLTSLLAAIFGVFGIDVTSGLNSSLFGTYTL